MYRLVVRHSPSLSTIALVTSLLVALAANPSPAQEKEPAKKEPAKATVPLSRVVLFNSGVGFYEHLGQVQGNARLDLNFKVDQINDLLKSMVVQDLDGGRVSTVTYGSKDPITKTLKSFPIDLTGKPTIAQLLDQVRGEKVEIEGATKLTGIIIGVETQKQTVNKDQVIEVQMLNLLTDSGLASVPLNTVGRIRLVNEKLNVEFRKALALLAQVHDTDKKTVSLDFSGDGQRKVRVGYIQESPVWKTSYRLVLGKKEPFLQGWAIVENTTESDWENVRLTLVSGRPISFVMDLYQPLYIPRPQVQLELYGSLGPQTYDQDLAGKEQQFRILSESRREKAAPAAPGFAGRGPARESASAIVADGLMADAPAEQAAMNIRQGVHSVAQAGNVGELFEYVIAAPVTLSRQRSAMLPIVNESIKGEKVSIYNPAVQPKHPLNGLKLVNSSKVHLMQGPITVFDEGIYAGDAKIDDIPPGGERLISYALDLSTEVAPEQKSHPEQLVSVRLSKGTLSVKRKLTRAMDYTIKNSGKADKKVLIEYPLDPNWKLLEPKTPAEKTRSLYRFAVTAEPGKPASLGVREEQVVDQVFAVSNLDDNTILFYVRANVVSDGVKAALREVINRKHQIQQAMMKLQQIQQQIGAIEQDQNRIRQNMAQVQRDTDLYRKYLAKFTQQEDQIEKLRGQVQEISAELARLQKALDEYLMGLDLS